MKSTLLSFLKVFGIVLLTALCAGCPIGNEYPLGNPGEEKIDKELVGTWAAEDSDAEVAKVKIEKKDANSFTVTVLERGELFALETDNFTGYVTELGDAQFVYFKPEGEEKFYHYQYHFEGSQLITNDISLLDGGVDAVTSTESYRRQVLTSMKMSDWGGGKIVWTKE